MIEGSCHCGNVQFSITEDPKKLVECNCSICRRIAALWGHLPAASVTVSGKTFAYTHGDKTMEFHICGECGCTTHWSSVKEMKDQIVAVNFRMCDPADVANFRIRKFDGADSWKFLD